MAEPAAAPAAPAPAEDVLEAALAAVWDALRAADCAAALEPLLDERAAVAARSGLHYDVMARVHRREFERSRGVHDALARRASLLSQASPAQLLALSLRYSASDIRDALVGFAGAEVAARRWLTSLRRSLPPPDQRTDAIHAGAARAEDLLTSHIIPALHGCAAHVREVLQVKARGGEDPPPAPQQDPDARRDGADSRHGLARGAITQGPSRRAGGYWVRDGQRGYGRYSHSPRRSRSRSRSPDVDSDESDDSDPSRHRVRARDGPGQPSRHARRPGPGAVEAHRMEGAPPAVERNVEAAAEPCSVCLQPPGPGGLLALPCHTEHHRHPLCHVCAQRMRDRNTSGLPEHSCPVCRARFPYALLDRLPMTAAYAKTCLSHNRWTADHAARLDTAAAIGLLEGAWFAHATVAAGAARRPTGQLPLALRSFTNGLRHSPDLALDAPYLPGLQPHPNRWVDMDELAPLLALRECVVFLVEDGPLDELFVHEDGPRNELPSGHCNVYPKLASLTYTPRRVICVVRSARGSHYDLASNCTSLHAIDSLPQPFRVYFRPLLDVYRAAGPCNWPPLANVRASPGACSARNLLQIRSPDYECPPATLAGSPASTDGLRGVVYGPEMRTRATTPPQWNVARPATECGDRGMVTWLPANGASAMLAALAPDAHPTAEWVLDAPVPPPVYSGPEIPTLD